MKLQKNYAVVYFLEGEVRDKVRSIQEDISKLTGSRVCLDVWEPHLTLGSGLIVTSDTEDKTDFLFSKFAEQRKPFEVSFKNFGGIINWKGAQVTHDTPYVLWLNVELNHLLEDLFISLRDKIISKYDTYLPPIYTYNPHVTIAYSDLTENGFITGKEYLETKNFTETIRISHIALVDSSSGKAVEYKRFNFKQ